MGLYSERERWQKLAKRVGFGANKNQAVANQRSVQLLHQRRARLRVTEMVKNRTNLENQLVDQSALTYK